MTGQASGTDRTSGRGQPFDENHALCVERPAKPWDGVLVGQARAWFFQANPKLYDIDAALGVLDRLWWRVPQYTSEIHVGDVVVIWRSGVNAGIVGVGRVVGEPQLRDADVTEQPFYLTPDVAGQVTRARLQVRSVPFIAKEQVRAIPQLRQHQILVAPMGTVFPLSENEWSALEGAVPAAPDVADSEASALPPSFAWAQRNKGVLPMPGGYNGYLIALRRVCDAVTEERPTPVELAALLETVLEVKPTAARLRESFLRKVGLIEAVSGICRLGVWTQRWLTSGDDRIVIAQLHGRCRFIGELLHAARGPLGNEALLRVANDQYGMGWDTQTQIVNRRGWLQSAGMLTAVGDGTVQTSAAGQRLLAELALYDPAMGPVAAPVIEVRASAPAAIVPSTPESDVVDAVVAAILGSATDSAHPAVFEQAVRDAFDFLGFHAEWLGGPGRTDVLLQATLGKDESYRVVVDCKTSGSGAVGDQQVDWVTLTDHKRKHDADHIALVAPNPSGGRLFDRAVKHLVSVISADQLAGLCRQHARAPLGLDDYRALFTRGGALGTEGIDERAEDVQRMIGLAAALCEVVRERSTVFGRLSARDLRLILANEQVAEGTTEDELQSLLDTLASPLLGVLDGSRVDGYRVTMSPEVAQRRIEAIARHVLGLASARPV